MRMYALSRDGTLAGLVWRVGLPMLLPTVEAATWERAQATADAKVSAGWAILEVEVAVVGTAPCQPPEPAQAPAHQGGGT